MNALLEKQKEKIKKITSRNSLIELYRFLFALWIVWYHGYFIIKNQYFDDGYIAVEFFFILSGFHFLKTLDKPKLPSIWKGGCASKRLGYVPPVSPNDVMAGFICSRMSFMAWLPSSRRAHRHTFHPIDHPVEGSPRAMRLCLAASKSSGVSAVIWLPGYSPQRCDT